MRGLAARIPVLAACLLALTALSFPARASGEQDAIETARSVSKAFGAIARKATPAVVYIRAEQAHPAVLPGGSDFPGMPFGHPFIPDEGHVVGQGSGVLISADGLILTNNHVVEGAERLDVRLADGREFHGRVVGTDDQSDIAVVRIEGSGFPHLELADSDRLEIGDWVIAIGSPFGLSSTVTVGIVSAKSRSQVGIAGHEDFIQTDAAINPGNSGGALVDAEGNLVGINTAIYSETGGTQGIGYAIPVSIARQVMEQIVQKGSVTRGWIGVGLQDITPEIAQSFNLPATRGVLITQVVRGSPADKGGIRPGDVLLAVNSRPVADSVTMLNMIAALQPGQNATLRLARDQAESDVAVTIGRRPVPQQRKGR